MKCKHPGCKKEATMEVPSKWCYWHWTLWFSYGDREVAKDYIRGYSMKALSSLGMTETDLKELGIEHELGLIK